MSPSCLSWPGLCLVLVTGAWCRRSDLSASLLLAAPSGPSLLQECLLTFFTFPANNGRKHQETLLLSPLSSHHQLLRPTGDGVEGGRDRHDLLGTADQWTSLSVLRVYKPAGQVVVCVGLYGEFVLVLGNLLQANR